MIDEYIAIIGIGCRFPGASDKNSFWKNLIEGRDLLETFSEEELAAAGVSADVFRSPGYVPRGYVLDGIDEFDASFFACPASEAKMLDPQQRLFLQCAWTALEDGGYAGHAEDTGVFASVSASSYRPLAQHPDSLGDSIAFAGILTNDKDYVATRTSYKLGLRGPSLTVSTACSSSLSAVHVAIGSLLAGECAMALAGGATVRVPQRAGYLYQEGMICSPDAVCRAFDKNGAGICPSSGVGVVLLKPYREALRDHDHCYAVIRASAMNNDGSRKAGYTAPSVKGQYEVIRKALDMAQVSADEISLVEAHGTGTPLGDPIEIQALTKAYREDTDKTGYCAIASLKSNMGHMDSAAGIGGLIKLALALDHGKMPPTLHFSEPNPYCEFKHTPFYPLTQAADWGGEPGTRIGAISAFGVGGTNVHMILQDASRPERALPSRPDGDAVYVLPVSARGSGELEELKLSLAARLESPEPLDLASAQLTLGLGRQHFGHRLAVCGRTAQELGEKLREVLLSPDGGSQVAQDGASRPVAMLFTGQGSLYPGMGARLYGAFPVFRDAVDRLASVLDPLLPEKLVFLLTSSDAGPQLSRTECAQPVLFAMEFALFKLWESFGIKPTSVLGHSIGEFAAACVAGVLEPERAAVLLHQRGRLTATVGGGWSMRAFMCTAEQAREMLRESQDGRCLAAANGPKQHVFSGPVEALQAMADKAGKAGIASVPLSVDYGFHSVQMEPIRDEFERLVAAEKFRAPRIAYYSSIAGRRVGEELLDPGYWGGQLVKTVRFHDAVSQLAQGGDTLFLEVGPNAILTRMAAKSFGQSHILIPSLLRGRDACETLGEACCRLYECGVSLDWKAMVPPEAGFVPLPTYPFRRDKYWMPSQPAVLGAATGRPAGQGDSLLEPLDLPEPAFRIHVDLSRHPALRQHVIAGRRIMPLGFICSLCVEASRRAGLHDASGLEQLSLRSPLVLDEGAGEILLFVSPEGRISIGQRNASGWKSCVEARVAKGLSEPGNEGILPGEADATPFGKEMLPEFIRNLGDGDGNTWKWRIENGCKNGNSVFADILLSEEFLASRGEMDIHPSLIDPILQLIGAIPGLYEDNDGTFRPLVPVALGGYGEFARHGIRLHCALVAECLPDGRVSCDAQLFMPDGKPVLLLKKILLSYFGAAASVQDGSRILPGDETVLCWRRMAGLEEDGALPLPATVAASGSLGMLPEPLRSSASSLGGELPAGTQALCLAAAGGTPGEFWTAFSSLASNCPARCIVATLNAWGPRPDPEQRAVWELARVFSVERPDVEVRLVDMEDMSMLPRVLRAKGLPPQSRIESAGWFEPVLEHGEALASSPLNLLAVPAQKTCLVTGGLGGLGLRLARLLVDAGARRIVLAGRSAPSGEALAQIAGIAESGASIEAVSCDVADRDSLSALLERMGGEGDLPDLGAVFHLAGAARMFRFGTEGADAFDDCYRAKAVGARLLDELTRGRELEGFVLFSSMSTLQGIPGGGAYGAANGAVEAVAQKRRSEGLPARCVNWGPFEDVGMLSADLEGHARRRSAGIKAFHADALQRLGRLGHDYPVVNVSDTDWLLFAEALEAAGTPLGMKLGQGFGCVENSVSVATGEGLPADAVVGIVQSALGLASPPQRDDNLLQLGLDSLLFLNLAQSVKKQWGVQIRPGAFFANPTIAHLEEIVGQAMSGEAASSGTPSGTGSLALRLAETVARMLGTGRIDDPDANLLQKGMDSLLFLQLAQAVKKDWGVQISPASFFPRPTLSNLVGLVAGARGVALDNAACGEGIPASAAKEEDAPQAPADDSFPLTDIQYAYWAGRSGGMSLSNISCYSYAEYDVEDLDLACYEDAWNEVIARHPMLRMVVTEAGRQRVLEKVPRFRIKVHGQASGGADEGTVQAVRDALSHKVHDASAWPLYSVEAVHLGAGRTRLCIGIDLLACDAHSLQIVMRDVKTSYLALKGGAQSPVLPKLDYTFRQYLEDLARDRLEGEEKRLFDEARAYWTARLDDFPQPPSLTLAVRPEELGLTQFVHHAGGLDAAGWTALKSRASRRGLTASAALLAAYADVVARWSSSTHFALNITLFNRRPVHEQILDIVGDFTTLDLLEVIHDPKATFAERAQALQARLWQDVEQKSFSGIEVIRALTRRGQLAFGSSYPVVFTSNISEQSGDEPFDVLGERGYNISQTPQVWLDNQVYARHGALHVCWDSVDGLFPAGTIDDMFNAYLGTLRLLASDDDAWDRGVFPMLPEGTLAKIERFNDTSCEKPAGNLWRLFMDGCASHPDALAVADPDGEASYAQLRDRAFAMADQLYASGLKRAEPVGVCLPKSIGQIVAVLGIEAAGGAYVPIDPELPADRRRLIAEEAGLRLVVTDMPLPGVETVPVAEEGREVGDAHAYGPDEDADLAYVIYTSGSTGKPKGVAVSHAAAVNTIADVNRRFGIQAHDRVFGVSRLTFDLSVYDIFGTFAVGASLVLPGEAGQKDPDCWLACFEKYAPTVWNSAPAVFELLLDFAESTGRSIACLHTIMLSGEKIAVAIPERIRRLAPYATGYSLGGATEAAIWSIFHPLSETEPGKPVPYGRPLSNQRWYVLDGALAPRPENVPGDLYIAGEGLALGYYRDPKRTEEAFIRHPETGERLYRTGDVGAFLSQGWLSIVGRSDFQFKIAGHRIEPGEIEHVLERHERVSKAVVMAVEVRQGKALVCYYTGDISAGELKTYAAEKLPAYMVPHHLICIDFFPMTPSGKVNRKLLPKIAERKSPVRRESQSEPDEVILSTIEHIWNEILERDATPGDMDFFLAGGDSVLAARLVLAVNKSLQVGLSLPQLFENPTLDRLAAFVARLQAGDGKDEGLAVASCAAPSSSLAKAGGAGGTGTPVDVLSTSQLDRHPLCASFARSLRSWNAGFPAKTASGATRIPLVTGATGFLGTHLAGALLDAGAEEVDCLVRCRTEEEGRARLQAMMERFGAPHAGDGRLRIVPGDLAKENMGIEPRLYRELVSRSDAVFHAGARIEYIYPLSGMVSPNVTGTIEVVRFALQEVLKPVHHVSTVAVFSPLRDSEERTVWEEESILQPMNLISGYAQSKWLAERILLMADAAGVPVRVYRCGAISRASGGGCWNPRDFVMRLVQGSIMAKCTPDVDRLVSLMPVDAVAGMIACIQKTDTPKKFFHLDGFYRISCREAADSLRRRGAVLDAVPYAEWRKRVAVETNPLYPLVPLLPEELDPAAFSSGLDVDNANAAVMARRIGLALPERVALLDSYLDDFVKS